VVTWVVAIRVISSTRRGFDSLLMHEGFDSSLLFKRMNILHFK